MGIHLNWLDASQEHGKPFPKNMERLEKTSRTIECNLCLMWPKLCIRNSSTSFYCRFKQFTDNIETTNHVLSLATFLFEHGHFQKKLQIENSIILLQRQFRKDFCHGIIHCI